MYVCVCVCTMCICLSVGHDPGGELSIRADEGPPDGAQVAASRPNGGTASFRDVDVCVYVNANVYVHSNVYAHVHVYTCMDA